MAIRLTSWRAHLWGVLGAIFLLALGSPSTAETVAEVPPDSSAAGTEAPKSPPKKRAHTPKRGSKKKRAVKKKQEPPKRPRPKRIPPQKRIKVPAPYRESLFIYRNIVSARSFDKNADLTYNPYYAMEFELAPTFWVGAHTYLTLDTTFSKELTEPDSEQSRETTRKGEVILEDIYLETGVPNLLKIPVVDIAVQPTLRVYVPTSKVSQARTLILAVRPGIAFVKRFEVFRGLSLFYRFSTQKNFHESTTAVTETPLVDATIGSTRSAESFMSSGVRNARFGLSNDLGLKLDITRRTGISLSASLKHQFLYKSTVEDPRISYEPETPTDVRYTMAYTGEVYMKPMPALLIAFGFVTQNFALTEGSTYQKPFFNRYTAIFLDLRLYLAGLASQLASKRGRK